MRLVNFKIVKSLSSSNPYNPEESSFSEFQKASNDICYSEWKKQNMNSFSNIDDFASNENRIDSLIRKEFNTKVGSHVLRSINRFQSINNSQYYIYEDITFENIGKRGYWIAISNDFGENWEYNYTGITAKYPYEIKGKSTLPLLLNDSTLQVEVCALKETRAFIPPNIYAKFKLIEDNLILHIDLNKTTKDTDNDGITDVVERKLMMNPFSNDSDNDGIQDSGDTNPLNKNIQNIYSILFSNLLNGVKDSTFISFDASDTSKKTKSHFSFTYLIVSNNPIIKNLSNTVDKFIIVSKFKHKKYLKTFKADLNTMFFSCQKRKLHKKEFYEIHLSHNNIGSIYEVEKCEKGWKVISKKSYII